MDSHAADSPEPRPQDTLRREIEEFYLPRQLVDAILELGEIPQGSVETHVGIGFLDIADYSFVSKFLSPTENQVVLNGLFSAFHRVLQRHGGYINKIEGDSMMFQFGGLTCPICRDLEPEKARRHIARELLYACVEMQRVCSLFNRANDRFLDEDTDPKIRSAVGAAFDIIRALRSSSDLAPSLNAFFQIRVRIGANIGLVTLGNLGPEGAKQYDVIGLPVITARRMEATAPVGGLRISKELYEVLEQSGVVDDYHQRFKREAGALFGAFREISRDELFRPSGVVLRDKRNVSFETYSVQVNPGLPEALAEQTALLLEQGEEGLTRIIDILQYYRGNRFVVDAIERAFTKKGVIIRKADILRTVSSKAYEALRRKMGGSHRKAIAATRRRYSLYDLFELLGKLQDRVKRHVSFETPPAPHTDYRRRMEQERDNVLTNYRLVVRSVRLTTYFHNYVFPLVFRSIRISMVEYQARAANVEELDAEETA